jgi:ABC-type transporter Mla MlaB component
MRARGVRSDAAGLGLSDHVCWVYENPADFTDAAVRWLSDGLGLGQRLLYVSGRTADEMHADVAGLPEVERLLSDGTLTLLSLPSLYDLDAPLVPEQQLRTYDALTRDAVAAGHAGLRVLAEVTELVVDPRRRADHVAWEHLADDYMSRSRPLAALCAYRRDVVGDAAVGDLTAVHPVVRECPADSPFRLFFDRGRLSVAGTVDTFGSGRLAALLRASHAYGAHPVDGLPPVAVLDVSGIEFVDARGAATLAEFAAGVRARGIDLSVEGAGTLLRRVWTALRLDQAPGVPLAAGPT